MRACRPSLLLLLPVACFLLGATLIAVYWPLNVRPDGGRGAMDGAGIKFAPPGTLIPLSADSSSLRNAWCWHC